MTHYRNAGITIDGVDIAVTIETEGEPEGRAEKVHLHAHDAAARALQALAEGKPPDECDGLGIGIDWEGTLAGDYDRKATDGGTERGLYDKYEVLKDAEPINGSAFVLRPDRDRAARAALWAYANATENETLADDLREWVGELSADAQEDDDDE